MKKSKLMPILLTAAIGLYGAQIAAACEWQSNKEGQVLVGAKCVMLANAEWAEAVAEIVKMPLEQVWPPSGWKAPVQMPNLRVDALRTGILNGRRDMVVAITNDGPARVSAPFVVRGTLHITDAYRTGLYQNGVIQAFPASLQTVTSLNPGDFVQLTLFQNVQMPNGDEDFDVFLTVFVDWDANLTGGDVIESDETDNLKGKYCRVLQAPNNPAPPPIPADGVC